MKPLPFSDTGTTLRTGLVVLVVRSTTTGYDLISQISDEHEIEVLRQAVDRGVGDPLEAVNAYREKIKKEDEDFGNYVEELLSKPFLAEEIRDHGVQWLKSKIRIENYQQCEGQAATIIARYAFKLFQEDPRRLDYYLSGPTSRVRVQVVQVSSEPAVKAA